LTEVAALYNTSSPGAAVAGLSRAGSRFVPVEIKPGDRGADDLRLELSDRVRKGEFFAFVEIPATIVDPEAGARIRYYSDHPSYNALPQW
jgi:hypothetical protein